MMKYYIGIDLGGTNIVAGVVDEQFQLIAKASEKTLVGRPAIEIAKSMAKAARTAAQNAGVPMEQIEMVGIGSPGIVDNQKKEVIYASNLYFQNVPIGKMVEDELHKPVFIANDADAAAYGEFMAGAGRMKDGKHISNMLAITLGTGVGGGVIVNGRIIEGAHGAGGEIGHITVNPHETAVCGCGKHGCLEQYSSATGVVRCMKKLLDENPDTPCTLRGTDFAAKDVFDAARAGDALAAREGDEMTDILGMALASIASTTDPEMFMVGGGVARAGDVLFNPLREHFKTYAFSSCRETPIVAATLGNDAGIYGAVRLIVGE